jgi:hypothetical protein
MKKKILILTLVIAGTIAVYSFKEFVHNGNIYSNTVISGNNKSENKTMTSESVKAKTSIASSQMPEEKPKILLMLSNDTGLPKWSPFLWWNYHHTKPQAGC